MILFIEVVLLERDYSTGQLAKILRVHPNTIRWYDDAGLISPAERTKKGYRKFNRSHLTQLRILRVILGSEYTNRKIRTAAFDVLTALRESGTAEAKIKANGYRNLINKQYVSARKAVAIFNKWMKDGTVYPPGGIMYSRHEAANQMDITVETLRNWERNGLITVPRTGKKNERAYGEPIIMRIRLIHMLRQNNYSISAIHNSLTLYDIGDIKGAASALNAPAEDPEKVYLLAGDHWLEVLEKLMVGADEIMSILGNIID